MRILHVTCQKPDSTGSGVYLAALVRSFKRLGHENAVICGMQDDDRPQDSLVEGTVVYPVVFKSTNLPFPICGMSDVMPYASTRYRDLDGPMIRAFEQAFTEAIRQADEKFAPDLVLCHHLYFVTTLARELLSHRRIAAICHSTDLRQLCQHDLMNGRIVAAVRRLDAIVSLHAEQKEEIVSFFGVPSDRVHIVGIGYDASFFHRQDNGKEDMAGEDAGNTVVEGAEDTAADEAIDTAADAAFDVSADAAADVSADVAKEQIILYVGKIAVKKGLASLINAFHAVHAEQPCSRLVLVGGYSDKEEYQAIFRQAESSGLPIEFAGKVPSEYLLRLYQKASVLVLPSFFEGLPLVIAEALACGCVVVATDLPGIKSFYRHFVPDAPLFFVPVPERCDTDTPVAEELPAFESALASAIDDALATASKQTSAEYASDGKASTGRISDGRSDIACLDWSCVAQRVLAAASESEAIS